MLHRQTLPRVLKKNLNREEARKDIAAFSVLEGDAGDRLLDHLCIKYNVFGTARNKSDFEAGYDEGVRAVIFYVATQRFTYPELKKQLESA